MVLKFFKSQQPLAYIVLGVIALVFWTSGYFLNFTINNNNALPLYNLLLSILNTEHKFIYFLLGVVLVASQAIHLNIIISKYEVLYKNSFLPGLFYILLMSSIPPFISFHPVLIVNSILIFVMDKIFRLYKNDSPLALDFDICVLLSIMALFYLPAVAFILIYMIGLIILRPFSWRDWIVGAMGLVTPVGFLLLYYFLNDQTSKVKDFIFSAGIGFSREFNLNNVIPAGYPLIIIWIGVLLLLSFLKLRTNFYKNVSKTRNYQQIILFMLIISLIMTAFTSSHMSYRFTILCIPLSVMIAYYFLAAKKAWLTETLFYLLIIFIIFNYITFN